MRKIVIIIFFTLNYVYAQNAPEGVMIDGIIATVGQNIITLSELETQSAQYAFQNTKPYNELRCTVLEELLLQKLLLTQAQYDSLNVSDSEVENELDRRMRYFIAQIGSREALEKYYNKSITDIKDEFRELVKNQLLIQKMQQKITNDVKVTPAEVRNFFNSLPEEEIPDVEMEFELYHLTIKPEITKEQKEELHAKITELRDRVLKGDNFSALARLYSDDVNSAKKGGELGFFERGEMFAEFEAAAFKLKEPGEVSNVVETKLGYHIIQLIERRGQTINARHILLMFKPSTEALIKAKNKIDSIYNLIVSKNITFDEAVSKFSGADNRAGKAKLINQQTMNNVFPASHLDATTMVALENINVGEVTKPFLIKDENGMEAYRIIYVANKRPPHKANLKEDYPLIQNIALEAKKQKKLNEWLKEKRKGIYIDISEEFRKCNFKFDWN